MNTHDKHHTNTADRVPELELLLPSNEGQASERARLFVRSHGMTDRGLVRPANEDQFLIALLTKAMRIEQSSVPQPQTWHGDDQGRIFLVADGIGGSRGGDRASALAVWSIEHFLLNTLKWFCELKVPEEETVTAELQAALRQADARVCMESAEHPELHGMGTTLTFGYSLNRELYVVHAGDSRCYLLRAGRFEQLTRDHTVAAELAEQGVITADQVPRHPMRNMVTNAVGGHKPGVRAEVHKVHLQVNDTLLFATDGLTRMVTEDQIAETLTAESEPRKACERLVEQTLAAGGKDNVTVIVARYDSMAPDPGSMSPT
jgi:serine/threonine protein phosphatase PrpC